MGRVGRRDIVPFGAQLSTVTKLVKGYPMQALRVNTFAKPGILTETNKQGATRKADIYIYIYIWSDHSDNQTF